jgi:hypothetical protein
MLRYFMNDLTRIPFVRSDSSLLAFLSCQDGGVLECSARCAHSECVCTDKDFATAKEVTGKITYAEDQTEGCGVSGSPIRCECDLMCPCAEWRCGGRLCSPRHSQRRGTAWPMISAASWTVRAKRALPRHSGGGADARGPFCA